MAKVVIIGPAHPLRGGLATFNHRLAQEFLSAGHDCEIWSFSLQYPGFLFPGKTQYSDEAPPASLRIHSVINSINPVNWMRTGNRLRKLKPDLIVVRFWLPFMGPALGTLLRKAKRNRHTQVICIADNIIPHEKRIGDKPFTRYFIKSCDAFITMSEQVLADLRSYTRTKPAQLVHHPLYDNFGEAVPKAVARQKLGINYNGIIFLFFGFIRKYKGLDLLLESVKVLKDRKIDFRLMVAGEFYEDAAPYLQMIDRTGTRDYLILKTDFIPDTEVKYFLSAADAVIQPYRHATQSGVTPLAYHFEKPMIVTNVGGLPALVPDMQAGLVVNPDPIAIADGMEKFMQLGADYFIPHLRNEKKKYTWSRLVQVIMELMA